MRTFTIEDELAQLAARGGGTLDRLHEAEYIKKCRVASSFPLCRRPKRRRSRSDSSATFRFAACWPTAVRNQQGKVFSFPHVQARMGHPRCLGHPPFSIGDGETVVAGLVIGVAHGRLAVRIALSGQAILGVVSVGGRDAPGVGDAAPAVWTSARETSRLSPVSLVPGFPVPGFPGFRTLASM